MASEYYFARDEKKYGPFSSEQLKQFAASGQLLPTDKVWKQGKDRWVVASSIVGLFTNDPRQNDPQPSTPSDPVQSHAPFTGSSIDFSCPKCKQAIQVVEELGGSKIPCPNCGQRLRVPVPEREKTMEGKQLTLVPVGESTKQQKKNDEVSFPEIQQFDIHVKIAAWGAGVGLLLLGISPLFKWVNFGSGGVIGLSGDGKIVLGITTVAMAVYITAMVKRKWLTPVFLGVQAWGTLTVFWMGTLIWWVGSILHSPVMEDNPFAALLATQVSPGAGLYLGLIGGIGVAGSLAFVAVRRLFASGNLKLYYVTQGLSCVVGILLAFFVGSGRPSRHESALKNVVSNKAVDRVNGNAQSIGRVVTDVHAEWKKTYNVSDKQWDELIANFKARKHPESVSMTEWWEEAKNKTPAQLNKLYPPLQPRERYRAEWADSYSGSRELDRDFNLGKPATHKLTLKVRVRTEPNLPIKELHGHLAFVKDNKIVYEQEVAEKPDVSFTDSCLVWLKIDPYDDNNQTHRTLRYAKDNELTPVFSVRKVVLADGKDKTFE